MPSWNGVDLVGLPGVSICQTKFDDSSLCVRSVSQTLLSSFERLLLGENPATVDDICSRWTPDVLLKIRRLNSSLFYAIEAYFCRQLNVHRHLRRWFHDVPNFFRHLDKCDGLISGAEALSFLDRRGVPNKVLDIYLPLHGVLHMGRFLKSQGYAFQASPQEHLWFDAAAMVFLTSRLGTEGLQTAAAMVNVASDEQVNSRPQEYPHATFDFIRTIGAHLPAAYGSHIRLIGLACDPMEFIINTFHLTGLMNMLTTTHAISLFPRATFMHEEMYNCRDLSDYPEWDDAPWVDKYRQRGFKVFVASDKIPVRSELNAWKRKVGDALTWILPYKRTMLNGTAPTLAPYSRYAFEVLDRSLGVAPSGGVARIAPRFAYSPMAWLRDSHNPALRETFNSFEIATAFADYYNTGLVSDDEVSAVDSFTEDEGDTEAAFN